MKIAASILWIAGFCATAYAGIGVEYQGVDAFVEANGDVRVVYDFLIVGDGTQTYDRLPVTLPRSIYDANRLNAHARRESVVKIEAANDFDETQWTKIPALRSSDKDSENDVWLDLTGWTPQTGRPVRARLEVWMSQLVAMDSVCDDTAGVLTGFTSFADPDRSATARWRIHLPSVTAKRKIVAFRELRNGNYEPLFPRDFGEHAVVEWETRGQPGYYWIYTMFPADAIASKLQPDWRYSKDSEPRSLPIETIEMHVDVMEENVTRMDIFYKAENTHSCLPLRSITFHFPKRGSASATMNGKELKSKKTGRRNPIYTFYFPEPGVLPGATAEVRISARFPLMIERIPERLEFVQLRFNPNLYGSANTQPGSRRRVRVLLFPDTDLSKVSPGDIPFSGTGTMERRPYVYWDLKAIQGLSVTFPRGRVNEFAGLYDFSRPSEWLAMLREVRGVQFFLIACTVIIFLASRLRIRRRAR